MNRVVGILVEIVPLSSPVCDETSRVKEHFQSNPHHLAERFVAALKIHFNVV